MNPTQYHNDPTMRVIRRSLQSGPKTIAALAAELRRDGRAGEELCRDGTAVDTPEYVRDSFAVAEMCLLELGCVALPETEEHRDALKSRAGDRASHNEIVLNEILWCRRTEVISASGEVLADV